MTSPSSPTTGLSLTGALAKRGYTHHKAKLRGDGHHDIIDAGGTVVFTGRAYDVWIWLDTLEQHDDRSSAPTEAELALCATRLFYDFLLWLNPRTKKATSASPREEDLR